MWDGLLVHNIWVHYFEILKTKYKIGGLLDIMSTLIFTMLCTNIHISGELQKTQENNFNGHNTIFSIVTASKNTEDF